MKRILALFLSVIFSVMLFSCVEKIPASTTNSTKESQAPSNPEDTSQEVDCTFLMVYPDTFTYENTPVAAKWLCTEEDIARERTAMEEQLKYELTFMIENHPEDPLIPWMISRYSDTLLSFGKCDAQFLKNHTVLLLSVPYSIQKSTVTRVIENTKPVLRITITPPESTTDAEIHNNYLFILDEVIESEDQIAVDVNDAKKHNLSIEWIAN